MSSESQKTFGAEAKRVRAMPCLCWRPGVSGYALSEERLSTVCYGTVQAAHVTARGMGAVKGGRLDIVSLCDAHHREAGEANTSQRTAFEQRYGLDLRAEADRVAIGHASPLGIRGLAQRWAHKHCPVCGGLGGFETLNTYELSALLGWVRREMAREVWRRKADRIASRNADGLADDDRKVLARHIADMLGAPFTEDVHGLAMALCEAAGWPEVSP